MYPRSDLARARNRALPGLALSWPRGLLLLLSLLALACDSGAGSGKKTALSAYGIDDGASLGESVSMLVTPDQEAVITLKTSAQVKIDAGSVTKELKVTVERPADKEALALVKTLDKKQRLSSAPYVVTPHGTPFEKDVEVTLPIAKDRKTQNLKVMWLEDEDDKEWKSLGKPEISEGKARLKVKHFSVLVLVEETPEPVDVGGDTDNSDGARALARLTECGLIERQGDFAAVTLMASEERCAFDCQLSLPCEVLESVTCSSEGAEPDLSELYACMEKCGRPFACGDGTTVPFTYVCDGEPDCLDGEDELDCPASTFFTCDSGEGVPASFACDGEADCQDASDEDAERCQGKLFTCDDGQRTIALSAVCDLYNDCADGSDEPARCAKTSCELSDAMPGSVGTAP